MTLQLVVATLLVAVSVLAAPANAGDDPDAALRERLKPICADQGARDKLVADMIAQGGEYEQATAKWDLDISCEQLTLPVDPVNDTSDPSDDASHTNWIYDARWGPDGTRIATAGRDKTVRIWDAASGKSIRRIDIGALAATRPDDMAGMVRHVRFLDQGRLLVVSADMHPLRVFDVESGKPVAELPFTPPGSGWFAGPFIETTASGLVLIESEGAAVSVYDFAAKKERYHLPGTPNEYAEIAASDAAGMLAMTQPAGERSTRVMVHKLETGDPLWNAEMPGSRSADIVTFSRDGKRLAVAVEGKAYIYDTATGTLAATLTIYPTFGNITLAFTADATRLIAGVRYPQLWDIATGKRILHFGPFSDLFHSADVSPDGKHLLTGHMGSDGRIWEVDTGVFFRRLGKNVHPPG